MTVDAIVIAIGAMATAAGTLITSATLGAKQLAEARATRDAAEHAARQVSPNHGSSLADSIRRVEANVGDIGRDVRQLREEKVNEHEDFRDRLHAIELRVNTFLLHHNRKD